LVRAPPPSPTLFPYTTLFRSRPRRNIAHRERHGRPEKNSIGAFLDHKYDVLLAIELQPATQAEGQGNRAARGNAKSGGHAETLQDRKSTRLNSSHVKISYAVF